MQRPQATRGITLLLACALGFSFLTAKATPPAPPRALTVPYEYASKRGSMLLHASVNQRPVVLILDTGAPFTTLRPEALGLSHSGLAPADWTRSGAGVFGDAIGLEATLELGGRRFEKRRVVIMNLSAILSVYKEKIDGVLGLDFLQQFSQITINTKERTITFIVDGL